MRGLQKAEFSLRCWKLLMLLFFVPFASYPKFTTGDNTLGPEAVYKDHEDVIELATIDDLVSTVYSSDKAWFVLFYAHWCGHCKAFKPVWEELSTKYRVWNKWVGFAAINCGVESCTEFVVNGTPTLRFIAPQSDRGDIGKTISSGLSTNGWFSKITHYLEECQKNGLLPVSTTPSTDGIPPLYDFDKEMPQLENIYDQNTMGVQKSSTYFVKTSNTVWFGRYVIYTLAKRIPDLRVMQCSEMDARTLPISDDLLNTLPAFIVVREMSVDGRNEIDSLVYPKRLIPPSSKGSAKEDTMDNLVNWITEKALPLVQRPKEIPTSAEPDEMSLVVGELDIEPSDIFHIGDVEKAIYYSLTTEVPFRPELTSDTFIIAYRWVHVLLKYLPLRPEIINFLKDLRRNILSLETPISSDIYNNLVDSLIENHNPFNKTPDDWIGCKGSAPDLRGYPCSLWQTMHALTVGAYEIDDLDPNTNLSSVLTDYIVNFLMCRECAKNFADEIQKSECGILPTMPADTILWLWRLHNKANKRLKESVSTDPYHPKQLWPYKRCCSKCYINESMVDAGIEDGFNTTEVLSYIVKKYSMRNTQNEVVKGYLSDYCARKNHTEEPSPSNGEEFNEEKSKEIVKLCQWII